ncbi:MAG: L-histidine N(alpha)-methyltransferase [Xanthomonadaceae bacterium]|nr:L-histidine N(alpha)-methyltransferase [Xanthomonadaceae bacterium]
MTADNGEVDLHDLSPSVAQMRDDVLRGLGAPQKWISPMYLYDESGSHLFDRICELPEYYPTRTERAILRDNAAEISAALGTDLMLVEPGSGNGEKATLLLRSLHEPVAFIPVEISREHLWQSANAINEAFPDLEVLPVCADFSQPFELPEPSRPAARAAVFFPGSTIGNFRPRTAVMLLANFGGVAGDGGVLLVGVDLRKDPAVLERAYDDAAGVTAEFNLNLLLRLNRELGADFDLDAFEHRAVWNDADSRMEMHLVSKRAQKVQIGKESVALREGEHIHTESSYKYTPDAFAALASEAGLRVVKVWMDEERLFSVQLLERS